MRPLLRVELGEHAREGGPDHPAEVRHDEIGGEDGRVGGVLRLGERGLDV